MQPVFFICLMGWRIRCSIRHLFFIRSNRSRSSGLCGSSGGDALLLTLHASLHGQCQDRKRQQQEGDDSSLESTGHPIVFIVRANFSFNCVRSQGGLRLYKGNENRTKQGKIRSLLLGHPRPERLLSERETKCTLTVSASLAFSTLVLLYRLGWSRPLSPPNE